MMDDCQQFFVGHSLYEELQLDDDQMEGIRRILQDFKNSLNKRIPPATTASINPVSTQQCIPSPSPGRHENRASKGPKGLSEYTMYMKERMPVLRAASAEPTCKLMKTIAEEWNELSETEQAKYGALVKAFTKFSEEMIDTNPNAATKHINTAWKALSADQKAHYCQ